MPRDGFSASRLAIKIRYEFGNRARGVKHTVTILHLNMGRFLDRSARATPRARQFLRNPWFDWRVALIGFLLLNLASAAFHFFFYRQVGSGEIFLVEKREPLPRRLLNRFELEETVARFEERRARFEELKQKPLSVRDPFTPPAEARK